MTKRRPLTIRDEYLAFGKPDFSGREVAAVARVMKTGWVGMGTEVAAFETELCAATGAAHVVTVNSCTSALFLALVLHEVGPGDEVIVPSLTWCSTANAALYLNARPVLCDVDPDTLCVTPQSVAAMVTPRTRAVMVVHYGGRAVDVRALRAALPPSVAIVEDAAHAFGATYPDGTAVGSSGNVVCFSFYANKNLSTGEGGALALADEEMANRARSLRQHALHRDAWQRFQNPLASPFHGGVRELGYKMNYTDLQASIGRIQLRRQATFGRRRLQIARVYDRELIRTAPGCEPLQGQAGAGHARHLYVVKHPSPNGEDRNRMVLELRKRNVGASIHYVPLHQMDYYREYAPRKLPATDAIAGRIMTLPISASMTADDARYVVDAMGSCT